MIYIHGIYYLYSMPLVNLWNLCLLHFYRHILIYYANLSRSMNVCQDPTNWRNCIFLAFSLMTVLKDIVGLILFSQLLHYNQGLCHLRYFYYPIREWNLLCSRKYLLGGFRIFYFIPIAYRIINQENRFLKNFMDSQNLNGILHQFMIFV